MHQHAAAAIALWLYDCCDATLVAWSAANMEDLCLELLCKCALLLHDLLVLATLAAACQAVAVVLLLLSYCCCCSCCCAIDAVVALVELLMLLLSG